MKTSNGRGAGVVGSFSACGCLRKNIRSAGYVNRLVVKDRISECFFRSAGSFISDSSEYARVSGAQHGRTGNLPSLSMLLDLGDPS